MQVMHTFQIMNYICLNISSRIGIYMARAIITLCYRVYLIKKMAVIRKNCTYFIINMNLDKMGFIRRVYILVNMILLIVFYALVIVTFCIFVYGTLSFGKFRKLSTVI